MKKLTLCVLFIFIISIIANKQTNVQGKQDLYIKVDLWSNQLHVVENNKIIKTYPVASGTELSPTPIGIFHVTEKSRSWGGGFGTRWLGINVKWGTYGIHGTNKPTRIGRNVSSGCIRMRNEDVEQLFELIPEGTIVQIEGPVTGIGEGEYKNLSVGSKGNIVQLVQQKLKGLELYHGPVDGIYEARTEKAVKKFQKMNQLPVTGGITFREYILLDMVE